MKLSPWLLSILIGLSVLGCYLNRAYARIYAGISRDSTANPVVGSVTVVPAVASSTARPFTYIALGDSLTAGVGAPTYEESYPYDLGKLIATEQNRSVIIVNTAWPGATSADVVALQLPTTAAITPDLVTILIGVNDVHNRVSLTQFQHHLRTVVQTLVPRAHQVVVMNLPYLGDRHLIWPPYRSYFTWQTARYNQALREVLADFPMVTLVDLHTLTHSSEKTDAKYYSNDHFHPSATGYKLWSQAIFPTLTPNKNFR